MNEYVICINDKDASGHSCGVCLQAGKRYLLVDESADGKHFVIEVRPGLRRSYRANRFRREKK